MPMLEYKSGDGNSIWIEVPQQTYSVLQSRSNEPPPPQPLKPGFLDVVKTNIIILYEKIDELYLFQRPREVEVELSLKFNAEAGVWGLAATGVESGYVVKLKWVHEAEKPKLDDKPKS